MKIKKVLLCLILCLVMVIAMMPKTQAAGLVIAFSESTANVGDTVTVTVTGNGVQGTANLTVSGNATLSQNSVSLVNGSASVTATINGEGSIRITATAGEDMTDSTTGEVYTGATGGTITVTNTSSSNSTTTTQESSNANLSNLGIRPNDFSGFAPGITTYNVTVPEDVESVEVYATAQDLNATISGTGNKTLAYGENALSVVVTAEDGTTKTYTINVTREGEEEAEAESTTIKNGLSNIVINNLELNPSFETDIYEYTTKYIGTDTSLDIQAVTTDPSYTVEILGNEELKEGENTITILVSDSEGNNVATYQLTVNKAFVDEEALAREEEEKQQQEQRKMLVIAGGIVAIILIIVIIIVIKRRRNRAYAEEFSGIPFAGINDEDDYYEDYDNYDDNYDDSYDDYDNYSSDNQFDNYNDELIDEEDVPLQENDGNNNETSPVEEFSEEHNQETNSTLDFDDNEEQKEKERAKRDFLEGYNANYYDEYDEDRTSRGRKKGKRFK